MKFYTILHMAPPKSTAQEKGVRVIDGIPRFYEKKTVKEAHNLYISSLIAAKKSIEARTNTTIYFPKNTPVELVVRFVYPARRKADISLWKTTRPDTDNLVKLLKDCMTELNFWDDDSQVCREVVEKKYAVIEKDPCIEILADSLMDFGGRL